MASFQVEREYGVGVQRLIDTLSDPAYLAERSQRFGGVGDPVVSRDGDRLRIESVRRLPMDKVPGTLRKFLPGDGGLVQVDEWLVSDGTAAGTWATDLRGTPGTLRGDHEVTPAASGCRYAVRGEVQIRVPLIGGKIAGEVASYLRRLVELEQELLAQYAGR